MGTRLARQHLREIGMICLCRILIAVLLGVLPGCHAGGPEVSLPNQVGANEIRGLIAKELPARSSSDAIESFFEKHKLQYSYDRFMRRYQAILRDATSIPGQDHAVVIYVYIDSDGAFVRAEVHDSFTGL